MDFKTMKIQKPGFENLTDDILKETVSDLKAIGIKDPHALKIALAQTIIINSLGGDFWAKECTTFGMRQSFFENKNDVRVVHLAEMLWRLKESIGFQKFLSKNNKNDFESTYYECVAAHWFLKSSARIEFIIPSQNRGSDFDIKVFDFNELENINVEVKARRESFHSEKNASNFLKKLRTQLPSDECGSLLCKIELDEKCIGQEKLINLTKIFLNGTSRVRFIIFCWDSSTHERISVFNYFSVDSLGLMAPIFEVNILPAIPSFAVSAGIN